MKIKVELDELSRTDMTWEARWEGPDRGIIAAWERGLEKRHENPSDAGRAKAGELLILPWKGGVDKPVKGTKYGTYLYLAMWQGLRGEALDVDTDKELTLVCSKTKVEVTFTAQQSKYLNAV